MKKNDPSLDYKILYYGRSRKAICYIAADEMVDKKYQNYNTTYEAYISFPRKQIKLCK